MASLMGVGPLALRGPLAPVGLMHGCLRQRNDSRSFDNTIRSPLLSVLYICFNWHVESQRALSSRPSEQRGLVASHWSIHQCNMLFSNGSRPTAPGQTDYAEVIHVESPPCPLSCKELRLVYQSPNSACYAVL